MKIDTLRSGGQSQGGLDASGGTLTGPLMLSRDPQVPMEAATKRYVDNGTQALNASNIVSGTLPIARLPAFSGDVTSEAGQNTMNLSNTGVTAGEYGKIVVDAKGRVTNGTGIGNTDIPNISFDKITTGKPTTLAGYGITDAVNVAGGTMTGNLILSGNPVSGEHMVPKQYVDSMTNSLSAAKTGDIVRKAYSSTPVGFLKCNGSEVSKTTYSDLYAIIGENNNSYNVVGSGKPWQQQYEFNNSQTVDIGPWSTGAPLPTALRWSSSVVTKNRIYLFGGHNGSAWINTIYSAPILDNGTLGLWGTSGTLPTGCGVQQAFIVKNKVYLIGGYNASNTISTIYTAPINADGTIGSFTQTGNIPSALGWSNAIVTNSKVYLLSGYSLYDSVTNVIYSSNINSDGSLGTWTTETNTLPVNLGASQCAVIKNRVYLLGGVNTATTREQTSNIYSAPINTDGTLGAWSFYGNLPNTLSVASIAVTKNRIYLIGGWNGTSVSNIVYSAPINTDGTLGTWASNTPLPAPLGNAQLFITSKYICLLGGINSSEAAINTTYFASFSGGLNDYSSYYAEDMTNYMIPGSGRPWEQQYEINTTQNGDITGWSTSTTLPTNLFSMQTIVTKNRVYLLGGGNGASLINTIYTAVINSDGTLGTWSTTTPFPIAIANTQIIVTKNRVYTLGGYVTGSVATSVVYTAPINSDGTLGTWTTGISLPVAVFASNAIITKNRVYLIGGHTGSAVISNIYTAPINADGTLGTWISSSISLPVGLHGGFTIITKNRIYYIGGATGTAAQSTVYTASINNDGIISSWSSVAGLPVNLYSGITFVTRNTVYLIGGSATNSSTVVNSVYRAYINTDGTLGPWITGTPLPGGFCETVGVVTKNRIYTFGGYIGNGPISTVYTAIISEGLNDYSSYYDGSITPLEPVNPSTLFKLPDMSATDNNGIYHYIKY